MSYAATKELRALAIDPSTRGFGFAVLEGSNRLIDCGVKETKVDKNRRALKLINDLIDEYQPNAIIVEDLQRQRLPSLPASTRIDRSYLKLAAKRKLKVRMYSRAKMKQAFSKSGTSTKQEIALDIVNRFSEFSARGSLGLENCG